MLNLFRKDITKKATIILFFFLIGQSVYAQPFTPGATLDPTCNPGTLNCVVTSPSGSSLDGFTTTTGTALGKNAGDTFATGNYSTMIGQNAGKFFNGEGATFVGFNAGYGTNGMRNTFIGEQAGAANITGSYNTAIGANANFSNSSIGNSVAIGYGASADQDNQFAFPDVVANFKIRSLNYTMPSALATSNGQALVSDTSGNLTWASPSSTSSIIGSTSGISNNPTPGLSSETWLGSGAGGNNGSNIETVFLGPGSGGDAVSADYSLFAGYRSGNYATTASHSVFLGSYAGLSATNAYSAVVIGDSAGLDATDARKSVFVGSGSGTSSTYAENSVFLGYYSGQLSPNAANSIFIGTSAGMNDTVDNTLGDTSILLGNSTSTGGYSNSIALGSGAANTAVNQFMIGSSTSPIEEVYVTQSGGTACIINSLGVGCSSDERLKTNIIDLDSVVKKILELRTVTFNWKNKDDGKTNIGFIAQNMQEVFPELVNEQSNGYLSVNYAGVTPILTKAIQELNTKIDLLSANSGFSTDTLLTTVSDLISKSISDLQDIAVKSIEAVSGTFEKISADLVFSKKVETSELCLDDVCVTREEFKQLVDQLHSSNGVQLENSATSDPASEPSTTSPDNLENPPSPILPTQIDQITENSSQI